MQSVGIISVTTQGSLLAARLAAKLPMQTEVYAKAGRNIALEGKEYENFSETVEELFNRMDGLIFIMATGIVVRTLAPLIVNKTQDPAIVVLDEQGQHAISLLSGHIGGANELAKMAADAVDGTPVITTATDVQQVMAPDTLAVKLELEIDGLDEAKKISSLLVNEGRVLYFLDESLPGAEEYRQKAKEYKVELLSMSDMSQLDGFDGAVVISDQQILLEVPTLYLRPPVLIAGIGCRRGTSAINILQALQETCRMSGRSLRSVHSLASVDLKEDEIGLLAAAQQLHLETYFYTPEELESVRLKFGLAESAFVKEKIGVGNVCETAALLASQGGSLVSPKKSIEGITIALARAASPLLD